MVLKKVHRVVNLNQKTWLKPYIDKDTELRKKKTKNDFEKDFFKLKNIAAFGKTVENVSNHRDLKLRAREERRNYLVVEPKKHTKICFSKDLLATGLKKKKRKQKQKKEKNANIHESTSLFRSIKIRNPRK